MAMLERTTAGLEPSRFKHLLPRVARAAGKSSRTLPLAVRCQDASGAAPAASIWGSTPAKPLQNNCLDKLSPAPVKPESPNASVGLLDFLYPRGAVALMQKTSPGTAGRRASSSLSSRARPQIYGRPTQQYATRFFSLSTKEISDAITSPDAPFEVSSSSSPIQSPYSKEALVNSELVRLLVLDASKRDLDSYDQIWNLYGQIEDKAAKKELELGVLLYLASSRRYTDAGRVLQLFDRLDVSQRNTAATAGAVAACLAVGDTARALALFRESTTTDAWSNDAPPGIDALIAHSLKTSTWDYAAEAWSIYSEKSEMKTINSSLLVNVAELPHLRDRLQALNKHVKGYAQHIGEPADGQEPDKHLANLQQVFKAVLEVSINHVDPQITHAMVAAMKNPRVYENFLRATIAKKNERLAIQAFSEYRLLANYHPHPKTLALMVRIYYPDNVRGMEDVLKDWLNVKGRLNRWGYQKYLAFYASRGDVKSVYRMWDEYTRLFPDVIKMAEDTFAHLLQVHAVRGDLARFEQVFAEIRDKHKVEPNIVCWNIRLHFYVERGRYTHAMKVFEDLCSAVQPDDYSFSTIMAMVGSRGDLGLVSDLYWLAQQCGVKITEPIIDAIVAAYCQNDRFDEAERLCVVTTREGKVHGAPYTSLWNTLIFQYALRHDLVAVNRILKLMTKLNVKYNGDTYSGLLFALAQCRQPRRAVELLRAAQEEGMFRATADHYTLLMMAYIRSKQPHRALQVNRLMHHMGYQRSSQQIQMVIKAFSQWQDFPKGEQADKSGVTSTERRELFAKALREFQRSLTEGSRSMRSQQSMGREAVRMHLGAVRRFSFIIFMLVQARDFAGVDEVMELYKSIAPPDEQGQPMPLKLCNALMLSDFYEGQHDLVKKMWKTVLHRAKEVGRPQTLQETRLESILGHSKKGKDRNGASIDSVSVEAELRRALAANEPFGANSEEVAHVPLSKRLPEHKIVAKMRYGLTDPLKIMQRVFAAERNADGLVSLVNKDILANGFLLDSKNWNHYVQNLARLGRIREAFDICETRLMGQWSGFASLRPRGQEWDGNGALRSSDAVNPGASSGASARSSAKRTGNGSSTITSTIAAAIAGSGPDAEQSKFNTSSTRLSRAQQLRESATRYNRPMTFTFMVLAKAYLELEQAAMWSSQAEREFKDLAVKFPGSVNAVRTMVRMNSRIEGRVFGGLDESDGLPLF
ncbi:coxi translation protein cya5 [Ophiostoma piceae UAMH 11346]|uniref:Coxi translation protein cya5 n=1 Tax=Ophiostoma piceae (strain UAMH 11346) TaxID=1262450 RepID=S3CIA4_OPHP1|nr:coxi translation protein cya5 [Ophiostoma piceae UAMH 11346]